MVSVNDYLKKLLYQYDCVVVPELGAFLTHYQPASFTESSGLFLPPRKRVAFNEALRLDDGILVNYIMLHEPLPREGAQRYVSQFVGELRRQVTQTGRFEVDSIGTFTGNDEGKLQFDPGLRHNFYGEAYGMSAIPAQSLTVPAFDAVVVEPAPTAVGPVLVRDDETALTPIPRPRPSYWRVAAAALLIGSLGLISYFSVIQPGQPLQSSLDPGTLLRLPGSLLKQSTSTRAPAAAKPVTRPAPAVTVEPVPAEKSATTVTAAPVAPSVAPVTATSAATAAPVINKPAVSTVAVAKPPRTTPYFTVIAGSFSSRRRALRLTRQLRKAGYADAFVIVPSRRGQLYKVAATGSANPEAAIARVSTISQIAGTTAWIYKN